MPDLIKTITEKNQFENIFYKFFFKNNIFLKTKNGDLKIEFLGYTDGLVAFKVPFIKNMTDTCLILTRTQEYTIYANLKFVEKQEDNAHIFIPIRFQVISAVRREDRKSVEISGEDKRIIYISRVISDFIIQNSLAMESKRVDDVKETVRFYLSKQFKHIKIYFCNEGMSDPRMKYFYDNKKPLLIYNINKTAATKDEEQYNFFINEIYSKDYYLINRKNLISEISVPVLYKTKIPYGYIQVNNDSVMNDSAFTFVKKMAIVVEEQFAKYKVFPVSEEKLLISDVSKTGLGIVFRERRMVRYFKEGSFAYFDIILPDNKKASCLAKIRSIGILDNKVIKVGCEITDMDALSEVNYEEFVESFGLTQEKA